MNSRRPWLVCLSLVVGGCVSSGSQTQPAQAPAYAPYPTAQAVPPGYPVPTAGQPGPVVVPAPTPGVAARPLLPPLLGHGAWQGETRRILDELIASLPSGSMAKVRGIPLVFDPDVNEVNAFAGCDDQGRAYMAGTLGLLDTVDAIGQTQATDELFGTQTFEAYMAWVVPRMVQKEGVHGALPSGIIPPQLFSDARRLSRELARA